MLDFMVKSEVVKETYGLQDRKDARIACLRCVRLAHVSVENCRPFYSLCVQWKQPLVAGQVPPITTHFAHTTCTFSHPLQHDATQAILPSRIRGKVQDKAGWHSEGEPRSRPDQLRMLLLLKSLARSRLEGALPLCGIEHCT